MEEVDGKCLRQAEGEDFRILFTSCDIYSDSERIRS